MNSYPADEQKIQDVERGRICDAVLPMPPGKPLSVGDSVLFALAYAPAGREICFVTGGDAVRVVLIEVTDLGTVDSTTGQSLFRLAWKPLGQTASPTTLAEPGVKSRVARARA